jgi:magnesium chelatase subunit I
MGNEVKLAIQKGEILETEFIKIPMVDFTTWRNLKIVFVELLILKSLNRSIKAFEPGFIAKANRGLLYVDEVNLLDDHLVDILLDSAVWLEYGRTRRNQRHPARFVLVGSGNPEEGELRPQLLDRSECTLKRTVKILF